VKGFDMTLKTRGKLVVLGLVTFGCAAALTAGGVAAADSRPQPPVLRITATDDNSGAQYQQVQQGQSTGKGDCPFGHHQAPASSGAETSGGDV
jgi:hypothetical protein